MAIGSGEFVLIDINHGDGIGVADNGIGAQPRNKKERGEEKELKSSPAHE